MTIAERPIVIEVTRREYKPNANQLLKELVSNRYCQGLLRFFVVHPNGRFSKLAIIHALDENGTRPEIERDLAKLEDDGVVKACVENGICYYMLTEDEPTRHLVLNLAEFDWRQWQRLDHYYIADRRIPA
jgi:hypothetical protein